jgi:ribosomal protein S18 acetylase RimI-like enzyme
MRIRAATIDDAPRLAELWRVSGLRFRSEDVRPDLARVLQANPDLVLVMEDGDKLVGSLYGTCDGRRGWMSRLATEPAWRGRGIARQLIHEFEQRLLAKGCRKVNLLIEVYNPSMEVFYKGLGYKRDEFIFMERWLDEQQ